MRQEDKKIQKDKETLRFLYSMVAKPRAYVHDFDIIYNALGLKKIVS